MEALARVETSLEEHLSVSREMRAVLPTVVSVARVWWNCLRADGQILFCGNGGSASDSQHLAAELVGRFESDRLPMRAIALTTDTSALTAIANDWDFERVFARQVEALGRADDVLVAISTSGTSRSILAAVTAARKRGLRVVGFTGDTGGDLAPMCDVCLTVPSRRTARIQEMHIFAGHCCCELLDAWHVAPDV